MTARDQLFIKPKEGSVYKPEIGKAYLFSEDKIVVMKSWPPMAWEKTKKRPYWVPCRPHIWIPKNAELSLENFDIEEEPNGQLKLPLPRPFVENDTLEKQYEDNNGQLVFPFAALLTCPEEYFCQLDKKRLEWFLAIPKEAREIAAEYTSRRWHILSFLARCGPPAYDLAISNPALAFALASNWVFHKPAVTQPLRSARALLKPNKKQKQILSWLGFPATEPARRALAKINVRAIDVSPLLYFRQALNDPSLQKTISHLPQINAGVLRIISDPGLMPFVKPSLLHEIANSEDETSSPKAAYLLMDTIEMFYLENGQRPLRPFRELSRLKETHDLLMENTRDIPLDQDIILFPEPPIEGSDKIIPITDHIELVKEGRLQNNCVASYAKQVGVYKKKYIYRVLAPERCTLSISKGLGGWRFSELKLANNEEPTQNTFRAVKDWIDQNKEAPLPVG